MKLLQLNYKHRALKLNVHEVSSLGKYSGLMFHSSSTQPLLFDFGKNVNMVLHSWFVFFPFLVLWLDEDMKILDFRVVHPFTFLIKSRKAFQYVLEVPLHEKYYDFFRFFVGNRKI